MDFLNTRSPYTKPPVNVFNLRITESNVKSEKKQGQRDSMDLVFCVGCSGPSPLVDLLEEMCP